MNVNDDSNHHNGKLSFYKYIQSPNKDIHGILHRLYKNNIKNIAKDVQSVPLVSC